MNDFSYNSVEQNYLEDPYVEALEVFTYCCLCNGDIYMDDDCFVDKHNEYYCEHCISSTKAGD